MVPSEEREIAAAIEDLEDSWVAEVWMLAPLAGFGGSRLQLSCPYQAINCFRCSSTRVDDGL